MGFRSPIKSNEAWALCSPCLCGKKGSWIGRLRTLDSRPVSNPAIEYFDIVNDRDEVIGRAPRPEVHAQRLLHRAVHILVFDAEGRSEAGIWERCGASLRELTKCGEEAGGRNEDESDDCGIVGGKADIVVCNPPWIPGKATCGLEQGVFDDAAVLERFLLGLSSRLKGPRSEGWLIISDLPERLGLREHDEVQKLIERAGLKVKRKATNAKGGEEGAGGAEEEQLTPPGEPGQRGQPRAGRRGCWCV